MSLVTTQQVEALVATGLTTDQLQDVIDREESWLAAQPGIGPLVGERTHRLWVREGHSDALYLPRPTDGPVEVTDSGDVELSGVTLIGHTRIERGSAWPTPYIDCTFIPSDQAAVERVVIELVRLAVTSSTFAEEEGETGARSVRMASPTTSRDRLVRSLRPRLGPGTLRVQGSLTDHRLTERGA